MKIVQKMWYVNDLTLPYKSKACQLNNCLVWKLIVFFYCSGNKLVS